MPGVEQPPFARTSIFRCLRIAIYTNTAIKPEWSAKPIAFYWKIPERFTGPYDVEKKANAGGIQFFVPGNIRFDMTCPLWRR